MAGEAEARTLRPLHLFRESAPDRQRGENEQRQEGEHLAPAHPRQFSSQSDQDGKRDGDDNESRFDEHGSIHKLFFLPGIKTSRARNAPLNRTATCDSAH